jgi:hypothetical protein
MMPTSTNLVTCSKRNQCCVTSLAVAVPASVSCKRFLQRFSVSPSAFMLLLTYAPPNIDHRVANFSNHPLSLHSTAAG